MKKFKHHLNESKVTNYIDDAIDNLSLAIVNTMNSTQQNNINKVIDALNKIKGMGK